MWAVLGHNQTHTIHAIQPVKPCANRRKSAVESMSPAGTSTGGAFCAARRQTARQGASDFSYLNLDARLRTSLGESTEEPDKEARDTTPHRLAAQDDVALLHPARHAGPRILEQPRRRLGRARRPALPPSRRSPSSASRCSPPLSASSRFGSSLQAS